jgi:uncharacterized repeat protein (TIGR01451 family)
MHATFRILPALMMIVVTHAALAQNSADVLSTLSVERISSDAQGKEVAGPAASARPGDVLQYIVDYKNQGKSAARSLVVTLPLPVGTEYIAGSASPVASLASVDGIVFAPVPLMRKVTQADGKIIEQALPAASYRFLRWNGLDLAAGKNRMYSTRVKVVSDTVPGAALATSK